VSHYRWIGLIILLGSLLWITPANADTVIHDNAHLLTAQDRQTILETNQQWASSRHRPQLWVYTYAKLPAGGLAGFSYSDPFDTAGNDLAESRFHHLAQAAADGTMSDGDAEYAVAHRVQQLEQRVSVILVYPDNGWHTIIDPSDDLNQSLSDTQKWLITKHLPNKAGTGASAMAFFKRYRRHITHHVANVKTIKPGMGSDFWGFIVMLPLLIWLAVKIWDLIKHPGPGGGGPYNDYSGWNSYQFGRWMGGDDDTHWDNW